jgi:hypothetical protein
MELLKSKEFVAAIIGAIVGGVFTLFGTLLAAHFEKQKREEEFKSEIDSFLRGIKAEVAAIFLRYQNTIGRLLSSAASGAPICTVHFAQEEYFSVFNSSSVMLGKLKDTDLQNAILEFYVAAKGMLDTLRTNNDLSSRFLDYNASNNGVFSPLQVQNVTQPLIIRCYQMQYGARM